MRRAILVYGLAAATIAAAFFVGPAGFEWAGLDPERDAAILMLRAYRVICGFIVGATLASSGVVFQAVLRNPLADPYVLGVSGGGALGAAAAILLGWHAVSLLAIPLGAFIAAAATLALVYALASRDGVPSIYGLILSGVVVSTMASSILLLMLRFASAEGLHGILWWTLGNLQATSTAVVAGCAACGLAGFIVSWLLGRELDALTLGSDMAHHLGVRTGAVIGVALGAATLSAAAAVALAGLIGFVGLLVPHAVRHLVGARHRRLLPAAAVAGGAFLVLCDAIGRSVLPPHELPVGVITALLGGPFFLLLLRRRSRAWTGA